MEFVSLERRQIWRGFWLFQNCQQVTSNDMRALTVSQKFGGWVGGGKRTWDLKYLVWVGGLVRRGFDS